MGKNRFGFRIFLMLPLLVPQVIVATGLFVVLLHTHLLGEAWVLAIADAALALPITTLLFVGALETLDPAIWTVASTLGGRWLDILRKIVLPIVAASIAAAFILAFEVAWDEVTFAVFIGPTTVPTLPSRMFFLPSPGK